MEFTETAWLLISARHNPAKLPTLMFSHWLNILFFNKTNHYWHVWQVPILDQFFSITIFVSANSMQACTSSSLRWVPVHLSLQLLAATGMPNTDINKACHHTGWYNKIGEKYSMEYTEVPKVLTPHHERLLRWQLWLKKTVALCHSHSKRVNSTMA
jgi:hypothetical protein